MASPKPLKKYPLDAMNAKPSTVQQIAKRVGMTTKEVRDIVTAVGTVATTKNKALSTMAKGNLKQQLKEVKTAATKGKSGTKPAVRSSSGGVESLKFGGKR